MKDSAIILEPKSQETIFSLLARAHLMSGCLSPLISLKKYTGHRGYKPLSGLPTNLSTLHKKLHIEMTLDDFLHRHTLFDFYKPFLNQSRRLFVIDAMLNSGAVKSRVGLLKSHCGASDQLAYCHECLTDDIHRDGFAHWRREHMVYGIEFCHLHQTPIYKINLNSQIYKSRFLSLPMGGEYTDLDWNAKEKLIYIAEQAAFITNTNTDILITSESYLEILADLGFITRNRHIRIIALQALVVEWMMPIAHIFPYSQLYDALNVERSWVANLVAGKEGLHHPLKHILMWGSLNIDLKTILQYSKNKMNQLELPLKTKTLQFSKDLIIDALNTYQNTRSASKFLDCSLTTLLVYMDRYGIPIKRRSKYITEDVRAKIIYLVNQGIVSSKIAKELNISVCSVNRMKRSICSN